MSHLFPKFICLTTTRFTRSTHRREDEERSQLLISFKDEKFLPNVRIQYTVLDFLKNFYVAFFVLMAIFLVIVFEAILYCIFRLGRAWGGRKHEA